MKLFDLLRRYYALPKEDRKYYRDKFINLQLLGKSGSQYGEDISIYEYLRANEQLNIKYLDLGANHPKIHSNTYLLYRHNSSGVLVDANPEKCKTLEKARPRDVVLNYGVAANNGGEVDFYIMDLDGLSTMCKEWRDKLVAQGYATHKKTIKVEIIGINALLSQYFPGSSPDFVSIDLEGLDYEILRAWDFNRWRPQLVCVETGVLLRSGYCRDQRFESLMIKYGYQILFQTFSNSIFVESG